MTLKKGLIAAGTVSHFCSGRMPQPPATCPPAVCSLAACPPAGISHSDSWPLPSQRGCGEIRVILVHLLAVLALLICSCQAPSPQQSGERPTLVIRNATLIDGTGRPPQENMRIEIQGERILTIASGEGSDYPDDVALIDATGKTVVPGLIDAHSHIDHPNGIGLTKEQERIAREYNPYAFLYHGITTAVNLSGKELDWLLERKDRTQRGEPAGPRMFTGALHFTAPGGWGSRHGGAVQSEAEIDRRLREYRQRGFDLVKILYEDGLGGSEVFPRLDFRLMQFIVSKSREYGLPVFIHAMDLKEYRDAVSVSPRAIVHGLEDPIAADDPMLQEMAEKNIFVTPTLVLFDSFFRYFDDPAALEDPILQAGIPDFVLSSVRHPATLERARESMNRIMKMDVFEWARAAVPILQENARNFHQAGIALTAGTDSGGAVVHAFQGVNLVRELELLVEAGLSPVEAIQAGTANAARMIGRESELGTVEEGKLADLLILEASPLENMGNLRKFQQFIFYGQLLDRERFSFRSEPWKISRMPGGGKPDQADHESRESDQR